VYLRVFSQLETLGGNGKFQRVSRAQHVPA
jgi:hypothetical protein